MQILKNPHINFMGSRKIAMVFSAVLLIASIASLAVQQLNFGIDFTGGISIEMHYKQDANLEQIRNTLGSNGFDDAVVQHFGTSTDVLIRLAPREGENNAQVVENLVSVLQKQDAGAEMSRQNFVGPQVGDELANKGGIALLVALGCILIYVAFRFEYRFGLGSVSALAHDVLITLGFFSITQMEFDLNVLAALLAVIGYSLNDTIVVFDRIRENFLKLRKEDAQGVVNESINETLGRTLVTSITTLLVLVALAFLGGEAVYGFAIALIVGIVVGTYSSIYVASSMALSLGVSKQDLLPPEKEELEEEMP